MPTAFLFTDAIAIAIAVDAATAAAATTATTAATRWSHIHGVVYKKLTFGVEPGERK